MNNRFWPYVDEIWTPEEKKYIDIIGLEKINECLRDKTPVQYLHLLKETAVRLIRKLIKQHFNMGSNQEDSKRQFKELFRQSHLLMRRNGFEYEWIIWLRDVVLKSLPPTRRFPLTAINQLLSDHERCSSFKQLLYTTCISRPHQWFDNLLVNSVIDAISNLFLSNETADEHQQLSATNLFMFLSHGLANKKLLYILREQLNSREELQTKRSEKDVQTFIKMLSTLRNLTAVSEDLLDRFKRLPLSCWPKRIRLVYLSQQWSVGLANRLTKLDGRFGSGKTDQFLDIFVKKYAPQCDKKELTNKLDAILKNLFKYTWLFEDFDLLMSDEGSANEDRWNLLVNEQAIKDQLNRGSGNDLDYSEVIRKLQQNEDFKDLNSYLLLNQMKKIKEEIDKWTQDLTEWLSDVKKDPKPLDIASFLIAACVTVKKQNKFYPRDTQLVALLVLASSSVRESSCMAEIATGEGKTLITALLAIYLSLNKGFGRNDEHKRGCVNVITSSSVLAEENVVAVEKLFEKFHVSVGNNCDEKCARDEDQRKERYKNAVIYGDLSSFQRDELITNFFGRDITRNRKADAVIIDEVCNKFSYFSNFLLQQNMCA